MLAAHQSAEVAMPGHNLVAVFPTYTVAEDARSRLMNAGVAQSDVRLSAAQSGTGTVEKSEPSHEGGGLLDWLFGDAPEEHRTWYSSNLNDGRTALSVHASEADYARLQDILEECDPIDFDDETASEPSTT